MKGLSAFLFLSASLLLAGSLNAQRFRAPSRTATAQNATTVFTVYVKGDGVLILEKSIQL